MYIFKQTVRRRKTWCK